ncbi:hypothetical protein [Methylosinus sp. Ce-a6]|uniref:hypothetical protein n=1 Tax=Methylosinus sp. Ce-a6 TaxID=2172005 RepID=UPI00135AC26F|nr:hypothetical protein [Methylosinus sp. Ce-a6]
MIDDDIIKRTQDAALASLTQEQRDAIAAAAEAREMAARARRDAADRLKRHLDGVGAALHDLFPDIDVKIPRTFPTEEELEHHAQRFREAGPSAEIRVMIFGHLTIA